MGLAAMKQDLHDRLWNAQQRWFAMREEGATKRALKLQGLRESGNPNQLTRNILFTGSTRRSYEETLKSFLEFAHERFGTQRLEDLGKREFRAFIEDGLARGLASSTLEARCSHLSKLGALIGKSESIAALARRYSGRIREIAQSSRRAAPPPKTPTREVLERAIVFLKAWDARHFDRTGQERAYHLAARLQLETAARSVSATERLTAACLRDDNQIAAIGKGGKEQMFTISPELHRTLRLFLTHPPGPLVDRRGYQSAYRRAIEAAGGRVTGTHGARRRSIQDFYRDEYHRRLAAGASPAEARREVRAEAVERLGHCRDRADQATCYLGSAA